MATERSLTRFSHATHFSLFTGHERCDNCHAFASGEPTDAGATPSSDFAPILKARCETCHQREAAGDTCLLCHNYHTVSLGASEP